MGKSYRGQRHFCGTCALRKKCIRHDHTPYRQVALMKEVSKGFNPTEAMKARIDTPYGRSVYSRRMGTVEPVFGHISGMKKLNRFTLRSKKKVTSQWLLYCMVHNIGKIQRAIGFTISMERVNPEKSVDSPPFLGRVGGGSHFEWGYSTVSFPCFPHNSPHRRIITPLHASFTIHPKAPAINLFTKKQPLLPLLLPQFSQPFYT